MILEGEVEGCNLSKAANLGLAGFPVMVNREHQRAELGRLERLSIQKIRRRIMLWIDLSI